MYVVARNVNKNPLKGPAKEERDALIRRMRAEGQDLPTIAQKFGITTARVSQITAGARKVAVDPEDTSYAALMKLLQGAADSTGRVTVPIPTLVDKTRITTKRATELIAQSFVRDGLVTIKTTTKHNHDVGMFKEITLTVRGRGWMESVGHAPSVPTPSGSSDVPAQGSGPVEKGHYVGDSCPGGHRRLAESIGAASSVFVKAPEPEKIPEAEIKAVTTPISAPEFPKEASNGVSAPETPKSAPETPKSAPEPENRPQSTDPVDFEGFKLMYPLLAGLRSKKDDLSQAAKFLERYGLDAQAIAAIEASEEKPTPLEAEILRYMASHGD